MATNLLIQNATSEARQILLRCAARSVVLHEDPRVELVTFPDAAIANGRHPDGYWSYTLGDGGEGICYWEADGLARVLYPWSPDGKVPGFRELDAGYEMHYISRAAGGLAPEQLRARLEVARIAQKMCAAPLCTGFQKEETLDALDALQGGLLEVVAHLLPEDIRLLLEPAFQHRRELEAWKPMGGGPGF